MFTSRARPRTAIGSAVLRSTRSGVNSSAASGAIESTVKCTPRADRFSAASSAPSVSVYGPSARRSSVDSTAWLRGSVPSASS